MFPAVTAQFGRKLETFAEHSEQLQRWILLSVIDNKWKDHLYDLDALKASISFRGWGQKDPLIEYKKEAYDMFVDLMRDIRRTVTGLFFRAQIGQARTPAVARGPERLQYSGPRELAGAGVASSRSGPAAPRPAAPVRGRPALVGPGRGAPPPSEVAAMGANRAPARPRSPVTVAPTPGRNQPCPCGSGKKYKKCCGRPS